MKVNSVHLISLKFCSTWPEKEVFSSLERCESEETLVALSTLQDLSECPSPIWTLYLHKIPHQGKTLNPLISSFMSRLH